MSSKFWLSRLTSISFIVFLILSGYRITGLKAQNVDSIVSQIKKSFPEEYVIVTDKHSEYTFELYPNSLNPAAIESTTEKVRSLKSGIKAYRHLFYNDYVEITGHKMRNPNNTKVRYDHMRCGDYERDGIFYHDARICSFVMQFENANEEYTLSYTRKFNDLRYFSGISLFDSYRTARQKVVIKVPDFAGIKLIDMNFDGFNISKTKRYDKETKQTIYEYTVIDIPPTQDVEDLPGYSCAFPHILVTPEYFVSEKGDTTGIFRQPSDLYNWYISKVRTSKISTELASFTENLVKDAGSDIKKIETVMNWIGERIRYIAFENGTAAFVPEDASEVFKKRYGDCKGMSNLAKTMLCHLGFDARLGWVYSGHTCFPDSVLSLSLDNHMICVLPYNNEVLFLDATIRFANIFEVSENIQGKRCVFENEGSYKIMQIPATMPEVNITSISDTVLISGDKLLLTGEMKLSGMSRLSLQYFLNKLTKENKDELTKFVISSGNNNLKVLSINAPVSNSTDSLFTIRYKIEVGNALVKAGNDFLLQTNYRDEFRNLKIRKPRFYKYSLDERSVKEHLIYIQIPPNLTVKKLPDLVDISNEKYKFTGTFESGVDYIKYNKRFVVSDEIVAPTDFDVWNENVERIQKLMREMIVLTTK
jgi:hypothetical protein